MRVVPGRYLRELEVEALVDFLSCPFRYLKEWVERDRDARPPTPELVGRVCRKILLELVRARAASGGAKLLRDDVEGLAGDFASDLRAGPEVSSPAADLAWSWWKELEAEDGFVMATDCPFGLPMEFGDDAWTLKGTAPFVIRRPEVKPRPVLLRFEPLTSVEKLPDLLEVAVLGKGAKDVLGLEGAVEVHHLAPGAELEAREVPFDANRWERALATLAAARESLATALTGDVYGFPPHRWGARCGRSKCPHVASCEDTWKGTVRSAP